MKRLVLLMLCLIAVVCGLYRFFIWQDDVSKYLNERWPAVSLEEHRKVAVDSAAQTLADLGLVNMAFGLSIDAIEDAMKLNEITALGISEMKLYGDEQLLRIEAKFSRSFEGNEPNVSQDVSSLLQSTKPEVSGRVILHAGITSGMANEVNLGELELRILPVFERVEVDRVTLGRNVDITVIGNILVDLLNRYKDNVSGALARQPVTKVMLPTELTGEWNPSQSIRSAGATTVALEIEANPVQLPIIVSGIAWLISENNITAVTTLAPKGAPKVGDTGDALAAYDKLKEHVESILDTRFGPIPQDTDAWVIVRKDLISYALNDLLAQSAICISGEAKLEKQRFSEKISFPDVKTVDCTPTRDCTPKRKCDFKPKRDKRKCKRCLIKKPFGGGCAVRGNDPFCEISKAAQNELYRAEAAAKKLDCERLKTEKKAVCEIEKSGEKALCETGKEILKDLARTGNFAKIDASIKAQAGDVRVCMRSTHFTEALDHIDLALDVKGRATAEMDLKFVPLGIAGHLMCQAPWSERQTFEARLREPVISIAADLDFITDQSGARVVFSTDSRTIPLHLNPSPSEFLLTSVNMTISCQGLNLLRPLVLALTPFVPELRGDIDYKLEGQTVEIDIGLPTQEVFGRPMTIVVEESSEALIVVGELEG